MRSSLGRDNAHLIKAGWHVNLMVHIRVNRWRIRASARHFHTLLEAAHRFAATVKHCTQHIDDDGPTTITGRLRTHLRRRSELHVGAGGLFVTECDCGPEL